MMDRDADKTLQEDENRAEAKENTISDQMPDRKTKFGFESYEEDEKYQQILRRRQTFA